MYLAPRLIIVLKMAFIQSVKLCITRLKCEATDCCYVWKSYINETVLFLIARLAPNDPRNNFVIVVSANISCTIYSSLEYLKKKWFWSQMKSVCNK